ncbi:MAG: DUF485 domain-containing protein [Planctomycetota bacterium]
MPSSADEARRSNARLGLWLFAIYLALYGGFVLINALAASWMETIVLAGLNLAIVYGFALIVIAFLMALLYGVLCKDDRLQTADDQREADST